MKKIKLGDKVKDTITGIQGIAIGRTTWLTGCDRITIQPIPKKGEVKRKDVANREKFLIDSVFDALGIDDKFIFEHNISKCQDTEEFALIKIEEYNERD